MTTTIKSPFPDIPLDDLKNTWGVWLDGYAAIMVKKHLAAGNPDVQLDATHVMADYLLMSPSWAHVSAAAISDIAYAGVAKHLKKAAA